DRRAPLKEGPTRLKPPPHRLRKVVRNAVALGVAPAVEQQNSEHEDGGEAGFARLLDRAEYHFRIQQAAVAAGGQRMLEKLALGRKQPEALARLWIVQVRLDPRDRIATPAGERTGVDAHWTDLVRSIGGRFITSGSSRASVSMAP